MVRGDATRLMLNDPARLGLNLLEEAGITKDERLNVIRRAWDNAVSHLEAVKGMAGKYGVEYVPDNQAQARAREHIFGVNRIAFNGNHADAQSIQVVNVVYNSPAWVQPEQAIEAEVKVLSDGQAQALKNKRTE